MVVSLDIRKEFLKNFQNKVITARKLLFDGNHKWSSRIFDNLISELDKIEWMDTQKKNQLILLITNSWWIYINSLRRRKEGKINVDVITYIDAYKRFL